MSGVRDIKESTEDGDCDVPMLQQIKDCPRDVEPAGGVEGGQAVPVEEVHSQVPVLEQPLPDVRLVISHGTPQPPAALGVDVYVVIQDELNLVQVPGLAGLEERVLHGGCRDHDLEQVRVRDAVIF